MSFINRPQRGVSLLEIMLALAVVAAMLLMGFNQYQRSAFTADVATAKGSVQTLITALNNYYWANCHTLNTQRGEPYTTAVEPFYYNTPTITVASLIPDYLPNNAVKYPFKITSYDLSLVWYDYNLGFIKKYTGFWSIKVVVNFPASMSSNEFQTLQAALGPNGVTGNNMVWQQPVDLVSKGSKGGLSPLINNDAEYNEIEYTPDQTPQHQTNPAYITGTLNACQAEDAVYLAKKSKTLW